MGRHARIADRHAASLLRQDFHNLKPLQALFHDLKRHQAGVQKPPFHDTRFLSLLLVGAGRKRVGRRQGREHLLVPVGQRHQLSHQALQSSHQLPDLLHVGVGLFPNGQTGHHLAQCCAHRAAGGPGASAAGNRAL